MNAQLLLEALELVERELQDLTRDANNGRCVVQQLGDLRTYARLEIKRAKRGSKDVPDVPGQRQLFA